MAINLERELAIAAALYGPKPEEKIMNSHFIRVEPTGEKPSFLEGMRSAARRLYAPQPDGRLKNDHTVKDMPDYIAPSRYER